MEASNPQAFAGYYCNLIATACNPLAGFAAKRAIRTGNYNPRSREIDAKARLSQDYGYVEQAAGLTDINRSGTTTTLIGSSRPNCKPEAVGRADAGLD